MGLCQLPSDHPGMVISTYVVALLPWSVLAFWDTIGGHWNGYRAVFISSHCYLALTLLPYLLLIPYAVLQGCSDDGADVKELMTSIVLILVSFWNLWRSIRGVFALQDVRELWKSIELLRPEDSHIRTVWDTKVSNALVDNDYPGEAPRVSYLFNWISGQGETTDRRGRLCIEVFWSLWMLRTEKRKTASPTSTPDASAETSFGSEWSSSSESLADAVLDQARPSAPPSRVFSGSIPLWWKWWRDQCVIGAPEEEIISPIVLARIYVLVLRLQAAKKGPCLFRLPSSIRKRFVRSSEYLIQQGIGSCFRSFVLCSRFKHNLNLQRRDFWEALQISENDVHEQLSKLPTNVQDSFSEMNSTMVREFSVHLRLNLNGYGSSLSRILLALSLPKCAESIIDRWLKLQSGGEYRRDRLSVRILALFLILERHQAPFEQYLIGSPEAYLKLLRYIRKLAESVIQELSKFSSFHHFLYTTRTSQISELDSLLKDIWRCGILDVTYDMSATVREALESFRDLLSEASKNFRRSMREADTGAGDANIWNFVGLHALPVCLCPLCGEGASKKGICPPQDCSLSGEICAQWGTKNAIEESDEVEEAEDKEEMSDETESDEEEVDTTRVSPQRSLTPPPTIEDNESLEVKGENV